MTDEPKLIWRISEVTPAVTRKAIALQKAIRAACTIEPEDAAVMVNYTYYLAATKSLEYPAQARQSVKNLAAFLPVWEDRSPVEVWQFYQDNISNKLRVAWDAAFDEAQNLFETNPVELPLSALTPEQRQEAETPGSPLTSNGSNSD